jgi:hypothetical protein
MFGIKELFDSSKAGIVTTRQVMGIHHVTWIDPSACDQGHLLANTLFERKDPCGHIERADDRSNPPRMCVEKSPTY